MEQSNITNDTTFNNGEPELSKATFCENDTSSNTNLEDNKNIYSVPVGQTNLTKIEDTVMYIMINKDLSMGKGKIASQVAHGVHQVVHTIIEIYISESESMKTNGSSAKEDYDNYALWCVTGAKTVVLNVPYNEMVKYIDNYKCKYIRDAGRTQVEPGSLTCIAFYPTNSLKDEMKKYKLL
jgi:PTH2 family peptidyl-tRNA hydrolase